MKKKILCLILCVLSLVPLLTMAVSAEETATDPILRELSGFTIGGKPFNEADYPVDVDNPYVEVLALREVGVDPDVNSELWNFNLYLYVYVPSAEWSDYVLITLNHTVSAEDNDEYYSGVESYNASDVLWSFDHRFVRVNIKNDSIKNYVANNLSKRIYDVYGIGIGGLVDYADECFTVTGFDKVNSLSYVEGESLTMNLDLYGTVYREEGLKTVTVL